jgi:hypothetical protein
MSGRNYGKIFVMEQGTVPSHNYDGKKFRNADEELAYLRKVIVEKESQIAAEHQKRSQEYAAMGVPRSAMPEALDTAELREKVIASEVSHYTKQDAERVLHEHFHVPEQYAAEIAAGMRSGGHVAAESGAPTGGEEIVLELSPDNDDRQIEALIPKIYSEGILNTIQIVRNMNNPHLEDDFHRFLIQYVKKGLPTPGLKENAPEAKSLRKTLYEIALPESDGNDNGGQKRSLKEMISSMEQFYAGMLSVDNQFAIELAVSEGSEEFVFYVSVPDNNKYLFEKHFLGVFPDAKIIEKKDDYNIYNPDGVSVVSEAEYTKSEIFPIKTYSEFDLDPLNVVLNTLSQIRRDGEGAAIQIIVNPGNAHTAHHDSSGHSSDYYIKEYKHALDEIQKGEKVKDAIDIRHTLMGKFGKAMGEIGKGVAEEFSPFKKSEEQKDKEKEKKKEEGKVIDQITVDQITSKIQTPIVEVNVRIVASALNRERAETILAEIESAFNQFDNALGNGIRFKRVKIIGEIRNSLHKFTYRIFSPDLLMPMSIRELNSIMHFPGESVTAQPQLKQSKANTAPVPMGLPDHGLLLGTNNHRNMKTPVYMTAEDRLRHFYTIGQTGTGKSTLLRTMIIQDIQNGDGVCFIDPHGSDVQDILSHIPKERFDDVIYFDPSYIDRPMALNMLEYNHAYPEQKTFVVNELFSIFQKLYGGVPESMGPMFEQYFRNATMLVIEDPDSGSTLLDVSRVMSDKKFRDMKLANCKNPIVVQFWKEIAEKAGGEGALANMVPYITSKFDVFLANDIMRPIIAQEKSSFNFREIMDNKKILLVNLAKGRLGDINSSLIGLILVGKILMAALSRVDSFGAHMNPFYLYIDEFQNITTPSIATILSEARKYKLSLTMAHQFIAQLDEKIRDAVFGNVGSMAVFRVGAEDAEVLQKQFEPVFKAHDIMNIDNMNCYVKMLSEGKPVRPFNIEFTWPAKGNETVVPNLKELSYLKYGKERDLVEEGISLKYRKVEPAVPPSTSVNAVHPSR